MRKTVLFIAMSLDGYIADSHGGVGWLKGQGCDSETLDVYSEFVKGIDTILMGWNTYHQITTELSPAEWIYGDFTTYVITHNEVPSTEQIRFVNASPADVLKRLKLEEGKDIWICGGANLVQQLMEDDLIDQYYISVIPTLLGSGIRLFGSVEKEIKLRLLSVQTYNGITDLIYERRRSTAMLEVGTKAPAFTLPDKDGKPVSLADFAGKKVVLYFYPKDSTPGCTRQACAFAAAYEEFGALNAVVVGVSKDSAASHQRFAEKNALPFILLSDPERTAIEAYGVWQEKKLYGKVSMGVVRSTYVINENGVIEKVMPKVKPDTNAAEILDYLRK